ncbi:AzlD domain-containing protein [Falsirhodobacter sp. 1013]|uniref:AzlD domain-containing protein n=1 Tax=Falsirhodobacter sp. 1013 TaxID=3417566 RepID=UPI003EC0972B
MMDDIWTLILVLGLGTFLLRFSFLGLMMGRQFPRWARRWLRYTPVVVLPGLVAPMVLWPDITGGEIDPARLGAALITVLLGVVTRSTMYAILGGAAMLYGLLWMLQ